MERLNNIGKPLIAVALVALVAFLAWNSWTLKLQLDILQSSYHSQGQQLTEQLQRAEDSSVTKKELDEHIAKLIKDNEELREDIKDLKEIMIASMTTKGSAGVYLPEAQPGQEPTAGIVPFIGVNYYENMKDHMQSMEKMAALITKITKTIIAPA